MARARTFHRCSACGTTCAQWQGRCPGCGEWSTLEEVVGSAGDEFPTIPGRAKPMLLREIDVRTSTAVCTGLVELDRVLGGGLVPGSVTLLGGEPGIGKSTLLVQAAASWAGQGHGAVLYVSAEESAEQVRLRAERLGCSAAEAVWLLSATTLPEVLAAVDSVGPSLLVLDSVQTVADPEVASAPGSPKQVTTCATAIVGLCKARQMAAVLVGHVTKDGELAGPRLLEHLVDTVLGFEGDRHHSLRFLRAVKHRFGPTGELGLFEMGERGLVTVTDASGMLLGDRLEGAVGSVVAPVLEGRRSLLCEVQALVVPTNAPYPRLTGHGVDNARVSRLLAVLGQRTKISANGADVHAAVAGGVRVDEPAADLALALAIASAKAGRPVPDDVVAVGEVGLAGEVRQVPGIPRRLAEAQRLGFRTAIVPAGSSDGCRGVDVVRAPSVAVALQAVGVG